MNMLRLAAALVLLLAVACSTSSNTMTPNLYETATPRGTYREVTATAVAAAKVKIVDVREPAEWTGELGHIADADLVPLSTLLSASKDWEHDDEIVLVCRSGNRSGRAAAELAKLGFTRAMNMKGGMIAWNAAGLPAEKK